MKRLPGQHDVARSRRWLVAVVTVAIATGMLLWSFTFRSPAPEVPPAVAARQAFARGDYAASVNLARTAARTDDDASLSLLAGAAAEKQGNTKSALESYRLVSDGKTNADFDDFLAAGDGLVRIGHPREAEFKFLSAVKRRPDAATAQSRLAMLYVVAGRRYEAVPHLLHAVRQGQHTVHTLCLLAQAEGGNYLPDSFKVLAGDEALDPLPLLAVATQDMQEGDWSSALRRLERARELDPSIAEVNGRIGQSLLELGRKDEFREWATGLSSDTKSHPLAWYVLGLAAQREGMSKPAARCFWEALRRDPEHMQSNYQLGQSLIALDRKSEAELFLERAAQEERLSTAAGVLFAKPDNAEQMHVAATATTQLGRYWEAWGWTLAAGRLTPNAEWINTQIHQLKTLLTPDAPRTAADHRPAELIDLSDYPLPDFERSRLPNVESDARSNHVRFTDDAAAAQIDFRYDNGRRGDHNVLMYELMGGGVGVCDLDRDGRPDLYLTQGGPFDNTNSGGPSDRLFRNLGEAFQDVTIQSSAIEAVAAFGQGVACGDYDGDGFDDIYVGNIGTNRLLRNNGDGTLTDVTATAGLPAGPLQDAWTTSVAMADLTGDGLADLFDVNYLSGPDVFERVCIGADGQPHGCAPTVFEGCPDRLLANRGDGRFDDLTAITGIDGERGNGLGIVVADYLDDGRLGIFIANDQTANHFYLPDGTSQPHFTEQALAAGLAFDRDGRAQACMGVAADDADGDGQLDLFVTNFFLESNTLYRGIAAGSFVDATDSAGLRQPSYRMLGFGTQFLDADLDGWSDLIVTNGHIDDFSSLGTPYRMRPQFFQNREGHFREVAPASLGDVFSDERLGRGLATLDWNRDGLNDVAISHLDSPLALLTNRSDAAKGLGVRLIATRSARDATGTLVIARTTVHARSRQLTAGSGYQASNERRIEFGLAGSTSAEITVRWPSGVTEEFGSLNAGSEWLLVEGRERALRLSAHGRRAGDGERHASR